MHVPFSVCAIEAVAHLVDTSLLYAQQEFFLFPRKRKVCLHTTVRLSFFAPPPPSSADNGALRLGLDVMTQKNEVERKKEEGRDTNNKATY